MAAEDIRDGVEVSADGNFWAEGFADFAEAHHVVHVDDVEV